MKIEELEEYQIQKKIIIHEIIFVTITTSFNKRKVLREFLQNQMMNIKSKKKEMKIQQN